MKLTHTIALFLAAIFTAQSALAVPDQSDKKNRNPNSGVIRDAEIEGLLRIYAKPIFKAAGINSCLLYTSDAADE